MSNQDAIPADDSANQSPPTPPPLPQVSAFRKRVPVVKTPSLSSRIGQHLYNHNPFYVISTGLTLIGLRQFYGNVEIGQLNCWIMMAVLSGYSLLMALTGILIVKLGSVWEDARTILLSILLLLVSASVCIDELLMLQPDKAIGLIAYGYGFAALLTEIVVRGLKIRLPAGYRVPLHLLLAIMFLYPYMCSPEAHDLGPVQMQWRVLGFPALFGVGLLTLLPVVRRGASAVLNNGTPWNWPWFPWPVFVFLTVAGAFRAYSMTYSFDASQVSSCPFAGYYLVPLALAIVVLLLEHGISHKSAVAQGIALNLGMLTLILSSLTTGEGLQYQFRNTVTTAIGGPLWLTLWAMIAIAGQAWLRGVSFACGYACTCVALLSVVHPTTTGLATLGTFSPWPVAIIAVLFMIHAFLTENERLGCVAWTMLCLTLPAMLQLIELTHPFAAAYHTWLLGLLLVGLVSKSKTARDLRALFAAHVPILSFLGTIAPLSLGILPEWRLAYVACVTLTAFTAGAIVRSRSLLAAAACNVTMGFAYAVLNAYAFIAGSVGRPALWALSWGVASFFGGILISLNKAGKLDWLHRRYDRFRNFLTKWLSTETPSTTTAKD